MAINFNGGWQLLNQTIILQGQFRYKTNMNHYRRCSKAQNYVFFIIIINFFMKSTIFQRLVYGDLLVRWCFWRCFNSLCGFTCESFSLIWVWWLGNTCFKVSNKLTEESSKCGFLSDGCRLWNVSLWRAHWQLTS